MTFRIFGKARYLLYKLKKNLVTEQNIVPLPNDYPVYTMCSRVLSSMLLVQGGCGRAIMHIIISLIRSVIILYVGFIFVLLFFIPFFYFFPYLLFCFFSYLFCFFAYLLFCFFPPFFFTFNFAALLSLHSFLHLKHFILSFSVSYLALSISIPLLSSTSSSFYYFCLYFYQYPSPLETGIHLLALAIAMADGIYDRTRGRTRCIKAFHVFFSLTHDIKSIFMLVIFLYTISLMSVI